MPQRNRFWFVFSLKNVSYETCPIFYMFHVKHIIWIDFIWRIHVSTL